MMKAIENSAVAGREIQSAKRKDLSLIEIGQIPPLGDIPTKMYCWAIRADRHGRPAEAFKIEVTETWKISDDEVLVLVMAAGVNFNGIWAASGQPISPFVGHKHSIHIAGSDASGVVYAVGKRVSRWKIGDEVVIHCNQDDGEDEECNGGDPMLSPSQRIWGYETPDGSFSQFTRVQSRQLLVKPKHLSWEEAACYLLTLSTAYRMLFGHRPHTLKPGQNVLVWGAAGGLGSMAVQLVSLAGANAIGVISRPEKSAYVTKMGARGVIDRSLFCCWGAMPTVGTREYSTWLNEVKRFGRAIWDVSGSKASPDIVIEHPGETTFPASVYLAKRGGMVVICAGTTGYNLSLDVRYLWTHQKRLQGSHFATLMQASRANQLVCESKVNPCLSEVFEWELLPVAHEKMLDNLHRPGNMSVLVSAPTRGLRTFREALNASMQRGQR